MKAAGMWDFVLILERASQDKYLPKCFHTGRFNQSVSLPNPSQMKQEQYCVYVCVVRMAFVEE